MTRCFRSIRNYLAFFTIVLLLGSCLRANAADMKAGVAKVDITPPLGTQMWGYFDRLKGAEGTIDPLYARVLVLEAEGKRLGLCRPRSGPHLWSSLTRHAARAAKQDSGIDYLIVQAIHTHAGPVILDVYPSGTPAWETADLDKIEQAIHEATQKSVPVRLGVGYGQAYIGYNRVQVNTDGTVTMLWNNSARIPTWPVDPT